MTRSTTPLRGSDHGKQLVIVGAGGHGRVVLDAARAAGWTVRGFLDNTKPLGATANASPILGPTTELDDPQFLAGATVIVALGDQAARRNLSFRVLRNGGALAVVCHPSATVSPSAAIGDGSFIAAGSIVAPNAVIGRFCILNTAGSADHDVVLEDGVQVCPGARLAGRVTCGEDSFIGTGAVVLPGIRIGRGAVVGAGAVVLGDVAEGITVVGNPACPMAARSGRIR